MLADADVPVEENEEGENYFVSMTDMMVGMLFVFIIMLVVFALNYRVSDDDSQRVKDCLKRVVARNAELSAEIDAKVNDIQSKVRGQIQALEFAADQRGRLLGEIRRDLTAQGLNVAIDERNGVLRLTEESVRFDPGRSDLDVRARDNVGRIAGVLSEVVERYAACRTDDSAACGRFTGAGLETIFVEGHTDATGVADRAERDRRNWQLSTDRATSTYRELLSDAPELRRYLNRRGEQILSVSGYSSTRPIAAADERESYAKNRRIDLRFVMDADTTVNLKDILALNEEIKAEIARLSAMSQASIDACK